MKARGRKTLTSRVAFWIISLMHDNRLLTLFKNPYNILRSSGLAPGQQVLEVGCGPGFFTTPAAEIVGKCGHIYAIDVNPWAIERVKEKVAEAGITNVSPKLGNAADSHLPDQSLDLAFLFGMPHIAGGRKPLLKELKRIIKPAGTVVLQASKRQEKALYEEISQNGFSAKDRKGRLLIFRRQP
jgi:ubiquinone/menaquinone biosynthesis C-methylase UbiE